jgi:hypothetical protein
LVEEVYNVDKALSKSVFNKKAQATLKSTLKSIFPNNGNCIYSLPIYMSTEVLEEYKHPDITVTSGRTLELDFFYPQLNLAIELQVNS